MTTASADGGQHRGDRLSDIFDTGDRARAFRSARRHSLLVRTARWVLPLFSLGVVGLYTVSVLRTAGWGAHLPQIAIPKVDPLNLTMDNPHYEGFNKDGGRYVVSADKARQELSNLGVFKLEGIRARLTQGDASTTDLIAKSGGYDTKTAIIELSERIKINGSNGLVAHLTQATVETKEGRVSSSQPVEVDMPNASVRAKRMTLLQKARAVSFVDEVRTRLTPPPKPVVDAANAAATAATGAAAAPATGAAGLLGSGGGPVDIASSRLDIDDVRRSILFAGDVKAAQGENVLQSPELVVTYEAPPAATPGAPKPAANATDAMTANRIDKMMAKGPVQLTRGARDQVAADRLDYDGRAELITLTGNVVVTQVPDRRVTAGRADVDVRADTTLLTGGVVAAMGRNELRGRRLYVDNKAGRTQLSSPAEPGHGAERISARFVRGDGKPVAKKAPTPAAGASPFGGSFSTDPTAPIDVQAATLDVDDHAKVAAFQGDVQAVQGDFVVRTSAMTVRYTGQTGMSTSQAAAQAAAPAGSAQINRIEARGKVIVTSKGGQTATGDWADFDTKANTVVLGGDVVLSQGQNVVRGTRLSIDMNTGESRIVTSAEEGWQARAGKGGAEPPIAAPRVPGAPLLKRDRPSAVFFPKDLKGGAAAPAQAPPAAGSAWDAQTKSSTRKPPPE